MATSYTTTDYQTVIDAIRLSLAHGAHLPDAIVVKILQMLEDASANVAGISTIASNPGVDGTPGVGTGNIPE